MHVSRMKIVAAGDKYAVHELIRRLDVRDDGQAQDDFDELRDPSEILRESCRAVFGPRLAQRVHDGYHAVARIRNRDIEGDSAFDDTYLGAGTPDPAADAKMAKRLRVSGGQIEFRKCMEQIRWTGAI